MTLLLTAAMAACGGGGGDKPGGCGPTNPCPPTPASAAPFAGDGLTATAGTALPTAPAVIVKDATGAPVPNVSVTFSVTGGGGSITGAAATTNASGVAQVGSWTLGANPGQNTLSAAVAGLATPVTFTATGTPRGGARQWTVLVYLAADNTLAVAGLVNLKQMEQAGSDQNVAVVVQAEFSPTVLQQAGCKDPSCINRPNWNTFRFAVPARGTPATYGPNGPATDIGNVDMTQASTLADFIQWGKQNYPAQHYMVVLWNHGGGFMGLIEDDVSHSGHFMSLDDLHAALQSAAGVDLLAFDMCLMGGYETMLKIAGLANYATVSEETVPGSGYPYDAILAGIEAQPTASPRTVAGLVADKFNAFYQGNPASATISAYDVSGVTSLDQAIGTLAGSLDANLGALQPTIQQASAVSQNYEFKFLHDAGDFLDSLDARVGDATIHSQIADVKGRLTDGSFRIQSLTHNGSSSQASKVDRSTGLQILIPSGAADNRLPSEGPASFAAYQALFPNKPWAHFLSDYLNGTGGATVQYVDQGSNRFEGYLVWDSAAVGAGVDVDFVILEPDGKLYTPVAEDVTPNGHFTAPAETTQLPDEGYQSNQNVAVGGYRIYALLYQDPNNFQPAYNLAYRFGQTNGFQWVLPQNGKLSMATSFRNDPNATLARADSGAYTDLQLVAVWNVGAAAGAVRGRRVVPSLSHVGVPAVDGPSSAGGTTPGIAAEQLSALRQLLTTRHEREVGAGRTTTRRMSPAPSLPRLRSVPEGM
jgi:hypothetical protein